MTLGKLQTKYKLAQNKHVIHYEYDMGDGWEHMLLVERRVKAKELIESGILGNINGKGTKRTSTGKPKEYKVMAKITGGHGHGVAEDVGSWPGWDHLKEAYKAKNTKKDEEEYEEIREWYEEDCGNGDPRGLKGKNRLEHFSVREANSEYEMMLENALGAGQG